MTVEEPKLGALFMSYFSIDDALWSLYMTDRSLCFPHESYIQFMLDTLTNNQHQLENQSTKCLKFIVEKLSINPAQKSSNPSSQYSIIDLINKLLLNVVRILPKETDLIVSLIEYGLKVYSETCELMLNQLKSTFFDLTSRSNIERNDHFNLVDLFQEKFFSSVHIWLNKECNESLLVNFGYNERHSSLTAKFREQKACLNNIRKLRLYTQNDTSLNYEMANCQNAIITYYNQLNERFGHKSEFNIMHDRKTEQDLEAMVNYVEDEIRRDSVYLGTVNEAQIYRQLMNLKICTPKTKKDIMNRQLSRGENKDIRMLSEFSAPKKFIELIHGEFKARLMKRANIDFGELVILRNKFTDEKFLVNKLDETINEVLAKNKKSTKNLEVLIKNLKASNPQLLQYFMSTLLEKQWPRSGPEKHPMLIGKELLNWIFTWEPWLFIIEVAVSEKIETLMSTGWKDNYLSAFNYFKQTLLSVWLGKEEMSVIKLLYKYEHVVGKNES